MSNTQAFISPHPPRYLYLGCLDGLDGGRQEMVGDGDGLPGSVSPRGQHLLQQLQRFLQTLQGCRIGFGALEYHRQLGVTPTDFDINWRIATEVVRLRLLLMNFCFEFFLNNFSEKQTQSFL